MLDHVFTDAIDALRQSLEKALLERLAVEEHLNSDVLSGDLTFETSYGLLGEEVPPRVRADVTMIWSTWSQTSFREWYIGDGFGEPPRIEVEVTLRIQRLAHTPDVRMMLAACPTEGPRIGAEALYRSGPTVELSYDRAGRQPSNAFEVAYACTYELDEQTLEDSALIDVELSELGGWIAPTLVKLNDLPLDFRPPDPADS